MTRGAKKIRRKNFCLIFEKNEGIDIFEKSVKIIHHDYEIAFSFPFV